MDWRIALLIMFGVPVVGMMMALIAPAAMRLADQPSDRREAAAATASAKAPKFTTESIRGRVVWLAEAQKRLVGAASVPEAADRALALETSDGRLVPLLEDERGRAFRIDKRLREIDVELLVRRYEASPVAQIIGVYQIKSDGKYELDYWCDTCAIAMYELKPCECCQGESRLRLQRVDEPKK
jgi:hypothetical protein